MKIVIAASLVVLVLTLTVSAKKKPEQPKDYPLVGTVVSFHAQQEVSGIDGDIDTQIRRVYVLKTETGELQITGADRGFNKGRKRPPLSIGQRLTFRTDGTFVWTVLDDGVEHRYYINSASD